MRRCCREPTCCTSPVTRCCARRGPRQRWAGGRRPALRCSRDRRSVHGARHRPARRGDASPRGGARPRCRVRERGRGGGLRGADRATRGWSSAARAAASSSTPASARSTPRSTSSASSTRPAPAMPLPPASCSARPSAVRRAQSAAARCVALVGALRDAGRARGHDALASGARWCAWRRRSSPTGFRGRGLRGRRRVGGRSPRRGGRARDRRHPGRHARHRPRPRPSWRALGRQARRAQGRRARPRGLLRARRARCDDRRRHARRRPPVGIAVMATGVWAGCTASSRIRPHLVRPERARTHAR